MKSTNTIILYVIVFLPLNYPPGYRENLIYFTVFSFENLVTIIDFLSKMKPYESDIVKLYEYTMIGYLGNLGTTNLLLQILLCWSTCEVDEYNQALPVFLYCPAMMHSCFSRIWFVLIKKVGRKRYS